jgi:hypothetical protein
MRPPPSEALIPSPCPHGAPAGGPCARCAAALARLRADLATAHPEPVSCAEFLSAVERAAGRRADLAGAVDREPALRAHRGSCAACRLDLAAAGAALVDLARPAGPPPEAIPPADLGFLRDPVGAAGRPSSIPWARLLAVAAIGLLLLALGRRLGRGDGIASPPDAPPPSVAVVASSPPARSPAARWRSGPPLVPDGGPPEGTVTAREPAAEVTAALAPRSLAPPPPAMPATAAPAAQPSPPAAPEAAAPAEDDERDPSPDHCALETVGPHAASLDAPCGPFLARATIDMYRFDVRIAGDWEFSTCTTEPGAMDTVLVLYRHEDFDPSRPCEGILAYDDQGCAPLSRLPARLDRGSYVLVVSEQTGDLSAPYRLAVEAPSGNVLCPRTLGLGDLSPRPIVGPSPGPATDTPTATPPAVFAASPTPASTDTPASPPTAAVTATSAKPATP